MTELYSAENTRRAGAALKGWRFATLAAAGGTLLACIVLCCLVNTGNAAQMKLYGVCTAVAGGWVTIAFYLNGYRAARAEYSHDLTIEQGRELTETVTGTVSVEPRVISIVKSIDIQPVTVDTGKEKKRLNIHRKKAKLLKKEKGRLKLYAVHSYITGWEVCK